jgi:hypothetical protein
MLWVFDNEVIGGKQDIYVLLRLSYHHYSQLRDIWLTSLPVPGYSAHALLKAPLNHILPALVLELSHYSIDLDLSILTISYPS